MIRSVEDPLREKAGFLVLRGNLFDSALMKTSVISAEFRHRFLAQPGREGIHEARAVVFEGPEDYHARINDPDLGIDETTILFIRGVGCVGYPGSAEVVNMQPPDGLLREGVTHLPTVGDGRQSGTSESPSILNASPEAAVGGGLALLRTGDRVRLDLNACRLDALVDEAEWRRAAPPGRRPSCTTRPPGRRSIAASWGSSPMAAASSLPPPITGWRGICRGTIIRTLWRRDAATPSPQATGVSSGSP